MAPLPDQYRLEEIDSFLSPSLLIFEDCLLGNIERMIQMAGRPARLRPHCKTHKMQAVIKLLLQKGIVNHKCATLAEAEMLAVAGCKDIFIGYVMVGPNLSRLEQLAARFRDVQFSVTCDDLDNATDLEELILPQGNLGVFVDVNTGMNRTGIDLGDRALELIQRISTSSRLNYKGLHLYDGHNRQREVHERRMAVTQLFARVVEFCDQLEEMGIETKRIVAGGTGSFPCFAEIDDARIELSPGTVVFYDAGYQAAFPDLDFEPAALILTRVVSKPAANLLTLDLGHKSCAADPAAGSRLVFPQIPDHRERQHNEEHLVIETESAQAFKVGDPLLAIPWHACPTTVAYPYATVIRQGKVAGRWGVTARNRELSSEAELYRTVE